MEHDLPFPILRTKLHRPQLAEDIVSRESDPYLFTPDPQVSLLLVSAPGGYGKSTWVSEWVEQQQNPSCWLSLDIAENDLTRFVTYLVASIRVILPSFGSSLISALRSHASMKASELAGMLCNELDEITAPLTIVLDNYDRIEDLQVHALVDSVLKFPPRDLLLVILTRRNPPLSLTALRASNLLREVRMRDLQLSKEGTVAVLSRATQGQLSNESALNFAETLDGWPAGLRFASLALARHSNPEDLFSKFDGKLPQISAYFGAEILARQPVEIRECLIYVSILESFCAPLCHHLWQAQMLERGVKSDLSGDEFLRHIKDNGIFCIDLDEHQQWFRLHHLFQDMLQQQLATQYGAEKIFALHLQASAWYEAEGMIDDALRHAMQAGGPEGSVAIMARHYSKLLDSEQWPWIASWLSRMPEELLRQSPELTVLKAFYLQNRGAGLGIDAWELLDQSEHLLAEDASSAIDIDEIQGTIAAVRAALLAMRGDVEDSVKCAQRALELLSDEHVAVRSFALIVLVIALCACGRQNTASEAINNFLAENSASTSNPVLQARTLIALGFLQWWSGDLTELKVTGKNIRGQGVILSLDESICLGAYFEGAALYDQNHLAEAVQSLEPIVASDNIYNAIWYLQCGFILANAQNGLGRAEEAKNTAAGLVQRMQYMGNNLLLDDAKAFQVDLSMRQGFLTQADRWARSYEPKQVLQYYYYSPNLTWIKYWAQKAEPQSIGETDHKTVEYEARLREQHNVRELVEFLAFKALDLYKREDHDASDQAMLEAIRLALPGGMVRPFIDLGQQVSDLLSRQKSNQEFLQFSRDVIDELRLSEQTLNIDNESVEQLEQDRLSRRELEVLGLLAQRLSNKEIAEKLFISIATVKRHTANIYLKLAVEGRRETVLQASRMGILRA